MTGESGVTSPNPHPRLFLPSWGDPGFALAVYEYSYRDFTPPAAGVHVLAGNNTRRWAVGFSRPNAIASVMSVGPFDDVALWGWTLGGALTLSWFKLFDYGPMVCYDWYLWTDGTEAVRVHEILIH